MSFGKQIGQIPRPKQRSYRQQTIRRIRLYGPKRLVFELIKYIVVEN